MPFPGRLLSLSALLAILGLLGAFTAVASPELLRRASVPDVRGTAIFDGHFEHGLGAYDLINGDRIQTVPDPRGLARQVARFSVRDRDIGPTRNPRAQIAGKLGLGAGDEVWVGWSTLFPRTFPRSVPGWLTFESFYGPPFDGTGPVTFQVVGDEIRWGRNSTYGWDVPWRMPLRRGRWIDFVIHAVLSPNPRRGFVELWVNPGAGWARQELKGKRRLYTRTIDHSNGGGVIQHRLGSYRKRGMFDQVTLYHAAHRIGSSFRAVAPQR